MANFKKDNLLLAILLALGVAIIFLALFFYDRKVEKPANVVNERISVVASIFPIYDILKVVGGERIDASLLLPPGASLHSFELSPQKAKTLSDANLLVYLGKGADTFATNILANDKQDRPMLDLSAYVNLRSFAQNEDVKINEENELDIEDEHEDKDIDPHFWLDPVNAALIAQAIASELSELDPDNEDFYQDNALRFNEELKESLIDWETQIESLRSRKIIVFHDAWFYFASRFKLNIIGALEPFPGKTPSPKYLEDISVLIRSNDINTLFIEPQLAPESARTLAQDLVDNIAILDPIGGVPGRNSYLELIDYNINTIVNSINN